MVIAITLLIILVVSGGLWTHFQRKAHFEHFQQMALGLTGTVQSALEKDMLSGERELVQSSIIQISREEAVGAIRLFSSSGKITAATGVSEIGGASRDGSVRQTLEQGQRFVRFQDSEGIDGFVVTTPVLNARECEGCHSADSQILGAIEVSLPTTIMQQEVRDQTLFFVVFGGLSFGIIGLVLWVTMRMLVLKPLSNLSRFTQKIAGGDYTIRANPTSRDEIGVLVGTFNQMAEYIEEHVRNLRNSELELAELNAGLEERISRKTQETWALNRIITTVNQSLDLDQILQQTLEVILGTMAFDRGAIHLAEDGSAELCGNVYKAKGGEDVTDVITVAEHAKGELRHTKHPVMITRSSGLFGDITAERLFSIEYACVPLKSKRDLIGILTLASDRKGTFSDTVLRSLEPVGEAIGIAVGNARNARRLDELNTIREQLLEKLISAQEAERRRIARELHDEASQSLVALVLNLETIADTVPKQYRAIREKLSALQAQAAQTLHGVRNLALELRPSALDDLGLPAAIDWYAKDFLKKRGLTVEVSVDYTSQQLSLHSETSLFRIIQEALNNVVQHTEATHVEVLLSSSRDMVRLQVKDNGRGFNVAKVMKNPSGRQSLGLHGMVERASLLGGTLEIESEPGQGTQITVEILLERERLTDG